MLSLVCTTLIGATTCKLVVLPDSTICLLFSFSVVLLVVFAASENLEKPLVWVPDPLVVEAPAAEAEAEAIPPEVRDVVEAPVNDGLRPPSPDIFR